MDVGANTASNSAANYLLEGLHEVGIDYLFCNMGTDHAPIIEAMAGRKRRGQPQPKVIVCPHENTAAHMAGGYALATGRGQGVLVHVDVGTANTTNAMHNLYRSRLPVLLMAGKAPFTTHGELVGTRDNYVHFVQEPFDQGSLVRPYIKWEWTLPSGVVVKEALRRAHTVMHSEPKAPVYLMLPREILTEMWSDQDMRSYPAERFGNAASSGADPKLVERLADALLGAKTPILLTSYAGRTPGASEAILELAEFAGIRVYEANMVSNISHDAPVLLRLPGRARTSRRPMSACSSTSTCRGSRATRASSDATFWAQIDVDVVKGGSPMWSFPRACACRATARASSSRCSKPCRRRRRRRSSRRRPRASRSSRPTTTKRLERAAELAANPGKPGAINAHYLCAELGKRIAPEDVIFSEATRNTPAVQQQIPRSVARHAGARRRRRARLLGRHGARHQAGAARPHGDPDRRRRQLLFQRHRLGVRGVEAIQAADPHHRARQRRLVGGEGIDAAGLSGRRRQGGG